MSSRSRSKKSSERIPINLSNPDHTALILNGLSDDEKSTANTGSRKNRKRKSAPSTFDKNVNKKRSKNLSVKLVQFRGSNVLFGDDNDINPSDLDEHGNIKDLIDYNDSADYAVYNKEMKKRERKEQQMIKRAHIIFSENGSDDESQDEKIEHRRPIRQVESEEDSERESGEDSGEEKEEDEEEIMKQTMELLFPHLMEHGNSLSQSLRERVSASNLSDSCKDAVLTRLTNDPEKPKLFEWIESLLNIPFGLFAVSPVTINDSKEKIQGFFEETIKQFDKNVYGLTSVKQQIIDYLGQCVSAGINSKPRTLALCGGPGIGKTFLIRHGISDALGRPLRVVNMGGIEDSHYMSGFEYSYANARYGIIAQILIEKKVMNPIILFEEVDKISGTKDGKNIQDILMHLTDPEQNMAFQDKYFVGIDIDLSKAILIFTLNDFSALDPILRNRLHPVYVPDPTREDKIEIAKLHMIGDILKSVNMDDSLISIPHEMYGYILDRYCQDDKGLRTLKDCLQTIILRLNTIRFIGRDLSGKLRLRFPVVLDTEIADIILKESNHSDSSSSAFMYM